MSERERLIDELVHDLRPVRRPGRIVALLGIWLVVSWGLVVGLVLADAPLRPDVAEQLRTSPRFLLETLLGLGAGALAMGAALRLGIPSPGNWLGRAGPAWALLFVWVGAYLYGLSSPSLEPSMLGKREGCYLQVLFFGLPPLVLGLVMMRRLASFDRWASGALVGAAAGAIPGLLMQAGCMYVPEHILTHHIAPIGALAVVGAIAGSIALRRP